MKSIAFINQKGGVGKTTCVINTGAGLALLGKKVLLIDFDPQASLTYSLGLPSEELTKTIYEVLKQEILLEEALIPVDLASIGPDQVADGKLFIVPAAISLAGLQEEFGNTPGKEFLFKLALKRATEFDYVLVDCPPSLGLLALNVLAAVQEIFIPVQTEFLALQGLSELLEVFDAVTQTLNPTLKLSGIICTHL